MNQSLGSFLKRLHNGPLKICILGSGNWGTAVSIPICENAKASFFLDDTVVMWARHELASDGVSLSRKINEKHENVKYLPGVTLPENLVAEEDLEVCVKEADLLVFVIPHQYTLKLVGQMKNYVKKNAKAVSLIKGLHIEKNVPITFCALIEKLLDINCCALTGANVAADVAEKNFCESTLGYRDYNDSVIWKFVFQRPYLRINMIPDVEGPQVCGAVKNIIALGAGFCDGLNLKSNTKSAIIRIGIQEMKMFALLFFDGVLEETFFDSCGFADVITTCFNGRNVKCAAEFVRRNEGTVSWENIEHDLLNGQKLQGHLTAEEIHTVIKYFYLDNHFPLFELIYKICFEELPPIRIADVFANESKRFTMQNQDYRECGVPKSLDPLRCNIDKKTSLTKERILSLLEDRDDSK